MLRLPVGAHAAVVGFWIGTRHIVMPSVKIPCEAILWQYANERHGGDEFDCNQSRARSGDPAAPSGVIFDQRLSEEGRYEIRVGQRYEKKSGEFELLVELR
jgi:hypothetical protein